MNKIKKVLYSLKKILSSIQKDHISAFSAYSSFFLMMSFLPILILVYTIFNIIGIDLLKFIGYANAENAHILKLLKNASLSSSTVISISTIFTAWSAGRAFHAITEGFETILKTEHRKNYFLMRIRSLLFSLVFSVVFAMIIIVGVFGNQIYQYVIKQCFIEIDDILFKIVRLIFSFVAVFFILIVTDNFVPDWKIRHKGKRKKAPLIISAALAGIVINLYTILFSIYFNVFSDYGSLNVLAILMLWIYGALYVVLLGFKLCVFLNDKNNA